MDDHVSKLEHMGKETVKKLQDIKGAAIQAGVDINIPENCINKGTFSMTCAMFHNRHLAGCVGIQAMPGTTSVNNQLGSSLFPLILARSHAYICCSRPLARQCKQVVLGLLYQTSMSQPFLRS